MLGSKTNSTENQEELCRNECKKDLEKLEILFKGKNNVSASQIKPNGYCNTSCLGLLGDLGTSTEIQEPVPKVDSPIISQKPSKEIKKSFAEMNSVDSKKSSEESVKPFTEINVTSDLSQKGSEIIGKPSKAMRSEILSSDESEKENEDPEKKQTCHEGKLCPTLELIMKQMRLNEKSLRSFEITSVEMNITDLDEKQDDVILETNPYCSEHIDKPRPGSNSVLEENKPDKLYKSHISSSVPKSVNEIHDQKSSEGVDSDKLELNCQKEPFCPTSHIPNSTSVTPVKPVTEKDVSQKPSAKTAETISTQPSPESPKTVENPVEAINTSDLVLDPLEHKPSTEIKSTDLTQTPDQHSSSRLSCHEYKNDNEFAKWKSNCRDGIYELNSLLTACEQDPNSILNTFKFTLGIDRKVPNGKFQSVENPNNDYRPEDTLGDYGDPKYHFLMVDSSTSISKLDTRPKDIDVKPTFSTSRFAHYEDSQIFGVLAKNKEHKTFAEPVQQPEKPTQKKTTRAENTQKSIKIVAPSQDELEDQLELTPEVSTPPKQPLKETEEIPTATLPLLPHSEEMAQEPTKKTSTPSPEQSKEISPKISSQSLKMNLSLIPADENMSDTIDEDDRQNNFKRISTVSWRSLSKPAVSDLSQSLDDVVKEATAKAENFRLNLDHKRQNSLLDLMKRKSNFNSKIEERKPNVPVPKKKKKKFFKCFEKKKKPKVVEEVVSDKDSDEISIEEMPDDEDKAATNTSFSYMDNYNRRRNTSFMENPVFEKKKELNKYLNNI